MTVTTCIPAGTPGATWLDEALAGVARDPDSVTRAFAFAARKVGRAPLHPDTDPAGVVHGTVDDAARAALVVTLADTVGVGMGVGTAVGADADKDFADRLVLLYRQGDGAERRGVLRGLDALTTLGDLGPGGEPTPLVTTGLELAADALRANDPSLVAAAVGPFGARYLDQHTWRHAILKLVFQGTSLAAASGLDRRADDELARMARDFAAERQAAGRSVPADLDRLTAARPAGTRPTKARPTKARPTVTATTDTRLSTTKE
ncbi:EboA domain-containing protein [Promicromonospora sp. NPDC019610]|uniref:EboA domain-containing protein n=1 Tax=Promicromonospora sp. NPDC019610 TaxID=3364405 RepID=UPI0037B333C4